jgi:hypothetical protein
MPKREDMRTKYMYATYYGTKWTRSLSRARAVALAVQESGYVVRRPYSPGSWDAPTFEIGAEVIADYSAKCVSGTDDASECAMMRERSVAGVSDTIPTCPVHGA